MNNTYTNLNFLVLLIAIAFIVFVTGKFLPSYTQYSFIFLVLPSLFFVFKKNEHLDKKKLLVVYFMAIIATIVWDNIAINLNLWEFPKENVIGWFLGAPLEEYLFAFWLVTVTLGIYTSLPNNKKKHILNTPHFKIIPVLIFTSLMQLLVLYLLIFGNISSYIKWLLVLAIIPSIFFIFRKGEKIDYKKMLCTSLIMGGITILYDYIFIPIGAWRHHDYAILGKIGIVPVDDILFSIFTTIVIIGFYTSIPRDQPFTGKWEE